ncbi:MAG: hypothetical protein MOGMAGMI_01311 [Candidatus Omnitrophica bacterium]|nr:hypothetical protein [Candidatus Omnitrophota bacterium]
MRRPLRGSLIAVAVLALCALPLGAAATVKDGAAGLLKAPLSWSRDASQWLIDLWSFRKNARENRALREILADVRLEKVRSQDLLLENKRLTQLLGLQQALPQSVKRSLHARVIGRYSTPSARAVLLDKGRKNGLRAHLLVLHEKSVVGKIVEVGPSFSRASLINDPDTRVGVIIQRTRQEGVLYGTTSGECRVKYLSADLEVKPGDFVETAGFGAHYPKGLPVGKVTRVWREPGQIYQVAQIKPLADLSRFEEVTCVE